MNTTYTLSLSRWHKVAERLSRDYTETVFAVREGFNNTRISAHLGESQETFLQVRAAEFENALERAFRLQDAVSDIRIALGNANAKHSITAALGEFDKINRRIKAVSSILEGQRSDMVAIGELKNLPEVFISDNDGYSRNRPEIRVRMLEPQAEQKLRKELEGLKSRAYALGDKVNDLNRVTVEIEISEEVARLAGL